MSDSPIEPRSGPVTHLERRANRMDLVSRWADDLAHEIKNPLHAMVINLELVKRRAAAGDPQPAIQRAEVVENELHRVHALVESMLRLVRPWPPDSVCDTDRIFEHLLPVLGARTRIRRVDYEHHPGGGTVTMAPGDLALVLLNLVDNAIDATPQEGRVATGCAMGRESVTVTVEDGGPGIADRISAADGFRDPQPRPGRSGLGLAVSAALVQEAGGTLTFEAGAGGTGTVAILNIPRAGSA